MVDTKEEYWEKYCNYLSNNKDERGLIKKATEEGFLKWKEDSILHTLINLEIHKLRYSIIQIENLLTTEEFKDFCDSMGTCIAYWDKTKPPVEALF